MSSARKQLTWIFAALAMLLSMTSFGVAEANEGTPGERIGTSLSFGSTADSKSTVPSRPAGTLWAAFSAGSTHSLGLLDNGTVLGFGNTADDRIAIPPVSGGLRYTAVAAGGTHSLLLTSAGTIRAIGSNSTGQLDVPTLGAGLRYTAIAAGNGFSVAVVSDGTLRAWGFNNFNQVSGVPSPQTGAKFISVAAGSGHAIALQDNGQVKTWGRNTETQLQMPVPVVPTKYTAVDASGNRSLALRSDGQIFGAGEAINGVKAPASQGFDLFIDLAVGDDFGFGLTQSGKLVSFGENGQGQRDVPFIGPSQQATSIDAGTDNMLAILAMKPTVTISSESNPVSYGDPFGLTVKVTSGIGNATGEVTLKRSGKLISTNTLSDGQRRFTVFPDKLEIGSNFFYAEYAGDRKTVPGNATALDVTVTKAKPQVYVLVPKNVSTAGPTGVTARVEAGTAALTGEILVKEGDRVLGTANLSASDSGEVKVELPRFTQPGRPQLTVVYGGSEFADPALADVTIPVAKSRSRVDLKLAKPAVKIGQKTRLSGQVTTGGDLIATGKVIVFQGKKKLRTLKVNAKTGRFNLKLPKFGSKGNRKFRVEYQGTGSIEKSKQTVTLKVKAGRR